MEAAPCGTASSQVRYVLAIRRLPFAIYRRKPSEKTINKITIVYNLQISQAIIRLCSQA